MSAEEEILQRYRQRLSENVARMRALMKSTEASEYRWSGSSGNGSSYESLEYGDTEYRNKKSERSRSPATKTRPFSRYSAEEARRIEKLLGDPLPLYDDVQPRAKDTEPRGNMYSGLNQGSGTGYNNDSQNREEEQRKRRFFRMGLQKDVEQEMRRVEMEKRDHEMGKLQKEVDREYFRQSETPRGRKLDQKSGQRPGQRPQEAHSQWQDSGEPDKVRKIVTFGVSQARAVLHFVQQLVLRFCQFARSTFGLVFRRGTLYFLVLAVSLVVAGTLIFGEETIEYEDYYLY